ncbi:MAG TPA: hydroxymethylglutaryl-CoA lyase [Anaeromyxobacteraceae bacterium]|nr:hydroxymethylglutaryl-CoA lyase [Anaeromyxobacteraceae bacterium]
MAPRVTVYEVGPRDGLQNEARPVSTDDKLALIGALADAGLSRIEATSFVSPRWIPQLADAAEVTARLPAIPGVSYVVLVPNRRGLDRLLEALVPFDRAQDRLRQARDGLGEGRPRVEAAVFLSVSETHSRKNINKGVEEAFAELGALVPAARAAGLGVRGYVSTVWGCPYEGRVEPRRAAAVVERLLALGCDQVSLGDTIGVGTPNQTRELLRLLRSVPAERLALHMHDTRGTALANVLAGLDEGITTFDASIGGLGGCPYAPGASGNLATEDLVYMLHGMGCETGVDWAKLIAAGALAERLVGRRLPSKALQAERATLQANAEPEARP